MTNSCAGAIDMSISVLCEPGQTILLPMPCYAMYTCHAEAKGVAVKHYRLLVSHNRRHTRCS